MTLHSEAIGALKVLLAAAVMLASGSSVAVSFDCSKARSKSERLICGDPQLSAMDDQLAALARAGKQRSPKPRQYQRMLDEAWLVRQNCQDIACVELWYRQRLAVLSHGGAGADPRAEAPAATAKAQSAPPPIAKAPSLAQAKPAAIPAPAAAPALEWPPPVKPAPAAAPAAAAAKAPPVPERPAKVAVAPQPTMAKSARELQNVTPGAPLQVIGSELGFDIPLTKDEFLDRYGESGGECGASKNLASLKAQSASAVSDCWSGANCPAPTDDLRCKVVRTAYDGSGRLVLFSATFNTAGEKTAGARALRKIARKFSALAGSEPTLKHDGDAAALSASGSQGLVTFSADITAADGKPQVGVFSVAIK